MCAKKLRVRSSPVSGAGPAVARRLQVGGCCVTRACQGAAEVTSPGLPGGVSMERTSYWSGKRHQSC